MNEKLNNYGLSVFKVTLTIVLAAIGLLSIWMFTEPYLW